MRQKRTVIIAAFIAATAISFFAGRSLTEQEYAASRSQRCNTLISFAVDKATNEDLSDPGIMAALISNIYAAYQFCDDPSGADQLHDLWNTLIFEGKRYPGNEDALVAQLRDIAAKVTK